MKKTSYILFWLAIGLLVLAGCITFSKVKVISKNESFHYPPAMCRIDIDEKSPFDEIEFSMAVSNYIQPYLFNGVNIKFADDVSRPQLMVDSMIKKYIGVHVKDNRLKISFNMEETDEIMEKLRKMTIDLRDARPLSLFLPRRPITGIFSTYGPLDIKGLETGKLNLFSNDYLNMIDCHIDTLIQNAGGNAKLAFEDSEINYMRLIMKDNFIKINCCDSSSIIRKVDFIAVEGIKTDVFLNEANIDTFRWDPPTPTQLTVRIKHPINIVK